MLFEFLKIDSQFLETDLQTSVSNFFYKLLLKTNFFIKTQCWALIDEEE
jgi:hypothetical protein